MTFKVYCKPELFIFPGDQKVAPGDHFLKSGRQLGDHGQILKAIPIYIYIYIYICMCVCVCLSIPHAFSRNMDYIFTIFVNGL